MNTATVPTITFCPPRPAHILAAPEPIFADRTNHPVHAEAVADSEFTTPGLSYDDYSRMSTQRRKTTGERRLPTPAWALNLSTPEGHLLLARFFELRAHIRFPRKGTPRERLQFAQEKMIDDIPRIVEVLDVLCREFVTCSDPARRRILTIEIENLDTSVRLAREGPGVVARIVHLYYSVGFDSVGVAGEIGIKPTLVRMTLFRLNSLVRRMAAGTDVPKGKRLCTVCGRPCPTQAHEFCSKRCAKSVEKKRAANTTDDPPTAKPAFCSSTCKEVFKHPTLAVANGAGFGVSMDEARWSGNGNPHYEKYLKFCAMVGTQPSPFHIWKLMAG